MLMTVRVAAAQAAVDKFRGQYFRWGERDCAHLCAFTLEQMGFEDFSAKFEAYSTYRGARRALIRAGVKSLADFLDGLGFQRIAPSFAVAGDIVSFPARREEDGRLLDALGIALGGGQTFAFAEIAERPEEGCKGRALEIAAASSAWRIA